MTFIFKFSLGCMAMIIGLSPFTIQAQKPKATDANIVGHVIDAQTGEHLPFSTIAVLGRRTGTAADETGHYVLANLPIDTLRLRISSVGYKSIDTLISTRSQITIELNIALVSTTLDITEHVVTGVRGPEAASQNSRRVQVLGSRQLERMASASLSEALSMQPGVRMEMTCSNCGVPELRMNGLSGRYTQILLDGKSLFSSLASVYGLEQLPSSMIERIEVMRGGGSAMYSASSIGGVVNVVTKDPIKNSGDIAYDASLMGDKAFDGQLTANASLVSKDFRSGVHFFAANRNRQAYDRDDDGFSDIPTIRATTVGFRSYFRPDDQSRINLEYHHIDEFRRGGDSLHLQPHQTQITEQLRHRIDAGGLSYQRYSKDQRHFFEIYTSLQAIDRNSYFGTHRDANAYGETKDLMMVGGGRYSLNWMSASVLPASLTVGAEYTYNSMRDIIRSYNRDVDQQVHLGGVYLQNEWRNLRTSLQVGLRVDKHNMIDDPMFCPRVNLRHRILPWLSVRAGYTGGYRAPQIYEEDLHVAAVGGEVSLVVLDPNLKAEYGHSATVSADWSWIEEGFSSVFTVEGFFTQLNNAFELSKIGEDEQGNIIWERSNSKGARIGGLNVEWNLKLGHDFSLQAAYTFQKSRYIEPYVWSDQVVAQRRMQRNPDHYGLISAGYTFLKRFDVNVSANFTGSMLVPHSKGVIDQDMETLTPTFSELGIRLAYRLPLFAGKNELEFSIGVKNILDHFQPDIDRGVDRDASYIYGPALPRTYFVGIRWRI